MSNFVRNNSYCDLFFRCQSIHINENSQVDNSQRDSQNIGVTMLTNKLEISPQRLFKINKTISNLNNKSVLCLMLLWMQPQKQIARLSTKTTQLHSLCTYHCKNMIEHTTNAATNVKLKFRSEQQIATTSLDHFTILTNEHRFYRCFAYNTATTRKN